MSPRPSLCRVSGKCREAVEETGGEQSCDGSSMGKAGAPNGQ